MTEMFGNVYMGLLVALSLQNLAYCLLGVVVGMFVGILPGLGTLAAISLLYPITFHISPDSALIMLAGIYYGGSYGGKITSILLGVPGETDSIVICLDGNAMAKQGRAAAALFLSTLAAFAGATIGIVFVVMLSPVIARIALSFGSPEYFALMSLGLIASTTMSESPITKSLAMAFVGILLGIVGIDVYSGTQRFTFGILELKDGISLVVISVGVFGVAEIIDSFRNTTYRVPDAKMRDMLPTRKDLVALIRPILRGGAVGTTFGALGAGATIATFISYGVERRSAADPSRFGKGALEGVAGPEAAANSADMTAFIPTLTLGIPGSASMALILSLLIAHGITPGPRLILDHPDIVWGLIMSFWIGNIMLLVLNVPLIGLWVSLLRTPVHYLYPVILMFICVGVFAVKVSSFEVYLVIATGLFGVVARMAHFPSGPLLLGCVLGPLMEEHFRRAMVLSSGDFLTLVESPISIAIYIVIVVLVVWKGVKRQISPEILDVPE